jgi:methyl-accepting chemotaxis protein
MRLVKRFLGVVLMLISLLMGLLSISGIIGTWSLSNSLTRGAVKVLSGADQILGTTEDALNRLESRVGTARDEVASFEDAVVSSAEEFADNPVVLTALSERLDLGIGPAVSNLRDTVQAIRETLLGVQQTIEAINSLPFVSLGENLPGGEKLADLSAGITALNEGVQEMRDSVREAKAEAAAGVVLRVGKATARADAGLDRNGSHGHVGSGSRGAV